ncbi:MAG: molybdopterin-dependent oxidoreductase [Halobacteriaceae archaeon]
MAPDPDPERSTGGVDATSPGLDTDVGLRGGVVGLAWVAGVVAASPLTEGIVLTDLAQFAIDETPGQVATFAIETFGKRAIPLLVVGIALGFVAAAVALGAAHEHFPPRFRVPAVPISTVFLVTAWLFLFAGVPVGVPFVVAFAIALAPPLIALAAWRRLDPTFTPAPGRRTTIRRLGGSLIAALGLGALARPLSDLLDVGPDPAGVRSGTPLPADVKRDLGRTRPGGDQDGTPGKVGEAGEPFEFDFGGMPAQITDVDDHYVIDAAIDDPSVDTSEYSLDVHGLVGNDLSLSYEDVLTHPDATTQTVTMVCISNEVGGPLISTVNWHGIPLADLLDEAGLKGTARDVVTEALDGYHEAIPPSVAREDGVMLAFGMNGERLPRVNGFPVRLLIPGRYGMKSTKWVNELRVVADDHDGYWTQRGWVEEASINTLSYLRGAERRGDQVAVGGVAYAGRRGIQSVEVSVDGGDTFQAAALEAPPGEYAWRRFQYVFEKPEVGSFEAVCRATDGTGERQTPVDSSPHPGGSTGWHSREFTL